MAKLEMSRDEYRKRGIKIAKRRAKGEALADIAKDYGISESRVSQLSGKYGTPGVSFNKNPMTREEYIIRGKEIARRFASGEKADDLASEFGISRGRVYQVAETYGGHKPSKKPSPLVAARKKTDTPPAANKFRLLRHLLGVARQENCDLCTLAEVALEAGEAGIEI